jgi:anti-repressor protein
MEQMQIYEHEHFGKIRTLTKDGDIWFVAADICDALDIANTSQAVTRLDEDERSMFNIGRQGNEKHGIKDKGGTIEHQYLFLQKR